MIRLICGPKGTGKTKIILEEMNKSIEGAKGDLVFITDKKKESTRGIDFNVRVLYCEEFGVEGATAFAGFVKGLLAGNSDIEYLFIDGLTRIIGDNNDDITAFLDAITLLEKEYGVKAVITVSKLKEDFSAQYRSFAE